MFYCKDYTAVHMPDLCDLHRANEIDIQFYKE